jgi:murein DD-endopeptidase MepM/ murein hydrolase activator NlpD
LSLLPFQERRLFDPAVPDAAYYLIEGLKGQAVTVDIATGSDAGYFADLFGLDSEFYPEGNPDDEWSKRTFEKVAAARETDSSGVVEAEGSEVLVGSSRLVFEPRKHRFYLLRIQPRLLEGGEFLVTFNSDPLLSWPLEEYDLADVQSFFGAPRDGGSRVHHGIDIFAPRGTPVIAVDDTRVYRIQIRDRGGNTVFLRDEKRGLIYYYAHLDEWAEDIEVNMHVPAGKELGTVGNTGNAVWSPPHLHFGIYRSSWRGVLDPWYFFIDVENLPEERRAIPLPGEERKQIVGSLVTEDTVFYRTYASRSLFVPSPAVRDRNGVFLGERGRPVMQRGWGREYRGMTTDLRLVGSRAGAYAFMDPERRIVWLTVG